jgi:hypothetical protein
MDVGKIKSVNSLVWLPGFVRAVQHRRLQDTGWQYMQDDGVEEYILNYGGGNWL